MREDLGIGPALGATSEPLSFRRKGKLLPLGGSFSGL